MSLRRVKGLRIKPLPQPRSPKFPNSVPPARGHTCEKPAREGPGVGGSGIFDEPGQSSILLWW